MLDFTGRALAIHDPRWLDYTVRYTESEIPDPPMLRFTRKCGCEWFCAFFLPRESFPVQRSMSWLTFLKCWPSVRYSKSGSRCIFIEWHTLVVTLGGYGGWSKKTPRHFHDGTAG